ncbi:MAG TPA: Cof-type HAD-IIB family hydrolase [Armatimonadota bacterium]|nr:Cof-type HAD-IIB family hydrolase [Armatimonadota bacterium]
MSSLPYELISLDLDLTFLDEHHQISHKNLAAVRRCLALGAKVIITSGRMYYTTLSYAHEMGLNTPIIAYNGAFIKREDTDEVLLHERLDVATAQEIVDFCEQEHLHLNYYLNDTLYTAKVSKWSDLYSARTGAEIHPVGDLKNFADQEPTKTLIIDEPDRIAQLYQQLHPHFAGRAYVTISNPEYLEFMPPTVNKGKAVAVVAEYYHIPQEKVIAFGDAGNDIPALAWAGLGVAMENAKPEAKQVADRIAPPYNDDGVAVVLEDIFGL